MAQILHAHYLLALAGYAIWRYSGARLGPQRDTR